MQGQSSTSLGNGSKRQATWAWFSPRGVGFFEVLCSGKIQVRGSAAKDGQGFGYVSVGIVSLIILARFKEEPTAGANFSVFSAQSS
jgi:hypothetical protein